ncbi:MAG: amidohydrolase family protein [Alphaproteobacteria bacterium]|jgi:predicted TIM-barrel fold metal-dependent hydrolase
MAATSQGGASMEIVDAHHHFWDPARNYHPWLRDEPPIPFRYGDYNAIRRRYLHEQYLADAHGYNVAGSVYIETEWDPRDPIGEMTYVAELRQKGLPSVAVGQAWLDRADAGKVLERLTGFDFVRSVRHKPRPGDMQTATRWRKGFALLAKRLGRFDLQTPWDHLGDAAKLAHDFPGIMIFLNHTGLPADRSPEGLAGWRRAMAAVAAEPNVVVKISGLGIPGVGWTAADNRWIVLAAIELFGVERCMFASNFPVDSLCGSFDAIYRGFAAIVADFSETERRALFAGNARRLYAIGG